ncbi:cobalt/nickel transport system permease protein [Methanomicrobium sp. W14]|uniref:cobalt ECF transporter T component CbiQ n=1 Tax=Methanomicrobium sp. W14 TaxID=2817839 RepID=UPI001AE1FBFC|nr:cobalt ECF transporter T component CbiQ [Methanomicrobium sp. W14]MBP2133230.1 cobalt/nickel transport system permease protein [Methanomicrobium sp. W14]
MTEPHTCMQIPAWMKSGETTEECPSYDNKRRKKNFIQKSISGVFRFFDESLQNEKYIRQKGFLQSLDPRVKLLSIIVIILGVSMTRSIEVLLLMYILSLIAAYFSKIDLFFFIKRIWLFIPVFAGIIILPVIFNVFMPGDAAIVLISPGQGAHLGPAALPGGLTITWQGLITATRFILRVVTCVSFAVLLFLTTRHSVLFKSLRTFHVPKIYVLTLDMCYRYIFLFSGMIRDFYMAKKSRTLKPLPMIKEQKWVGERIGHTLIKSLKTGEMVHMAMVSRGFNGDAKIMDTFCANRRDYISGVFSVILGVSLIIFSQITIIH